jgi:glycosyltransferase involved in cell wall biosynthesis
MVNAMTASVSVVIPTFNGASFILEALESVFAQTLPPREIIVVDDCSADETVALVEKAAAESPVPIRLIRLPCNSGGPAQPMNLGVETASSDVVAFLDQDDIMDKDKVELVSQVLGKDPQVGLAFGQFHYMDRNGSLHIPVRDLYDIFPKETSTLDAGEVFFSIVNHGYRFGGAGGTAVTKSAWRDLRGFDSRFIICWDLDFALRLALRSWRVAYVAHEFFRHRRHDRNLTLSENGMRLFREEMQILFRILRSSALLPAAWRSALLSGLQARISGDVISPHSVSTGLLCAAGSRARRR